MLRSTPVRRSERLGDLRFRMCTGALGKAGPFRRSEAHRRQQQFFASWCGLPDAAQPPFVLHRTCLRLTASDCLGRIERGAGFGEILRIGAMDAIAIIPTVTAPTVTGFRSPSTLTTDGQPPFARRFHVRCWRTPMLFCGGPGRETFGSAGFLWWPVCEPCRQARHPRFAANGGSPAITTGGHMATALSGHRPASYPSPPPWRCRLPTQPGGAACR
ncbi:hypothetical protein R20233_01304 [Ralstonia sp. LMG 32965]|nr:hypothetical protein R20233_01304 [Ralstonia sp. LMG 32965]